MKLKLMHSLLDVSSYIYEEMTDEFTPKDLGNSFWKFLKSKFLDDNTQKIKVADFVYDYVLHLDDTYYQKKYGINLTNIKKSKQQLQFVVEVITKMMKYSGVSLVDW